MSHINLGFPFYCSLLSVTSGLLHTKGYRQTHHDHIKSPVLKGRQERTSRRVKKGPDILLIADTLICTNTAVIHSCNEVYFPN